MYSIQHYVIKFVSNFRHVSGFSPGTPVSSTNNTDRHDITEINIVESGAKYHNPPNPQYDTPTQIFLIEKKLSIQMLVYTFKSLFRNSLMIPYKVYNIYKNQQYLRWPPSQDKC